MWLKLVGSTMVIISCSMIGFIVAGNFKYRPKVLRNLQTALSMFETEINYSNSPLPKAFENISKKCEKDVASLFDSTAKNLCLRCGLTANEAWQKSLKDFCINSCISNDDYEILVAFGKYLGSTDRQNQIKNIKVTLNYLKQQEIKSIEEKQKNEKLWRYLGILSGLMILLLSY